MPGQFSDDDGLPGPTSRSWSRRQWMGTVAAGAMLTSWLGGQEESLGQERGVRPAQSSEVQIVNPRARVPVSLIVDDSTCLVNLNRFAMPQFDEAFQGKNETYHRDWRNWPAEIPDSFVREFNDWSRETGVKGKYSIVPYPACVGRIDRVLPGWSRRELFDSLAYVRDEMVAHWDLHPEMVTHTRVIDTKTGHPYPELSLATMENWDWTTGKSVEELTDYLVYALQILKNVDLSCEGVTTPGGFGTRARPQLAAAALTAVKEVYGAEIPHYFRDLYDRGTESVAPRVELASGLDGNDPQCVVSIVGCTGDWTGGWDCSLPEGVDRFISPDLQTGRMVDVIDRGEPAIMVCHWTGIYFNGEELGLQILREVVRRLTERYDHLIWMKLSEIARYWAAKELTQILALDDGFEFRAPYACPNFTLRMPARDNLQPQITQGPVGTLPLALREVPVASQVVEGTFCRQHDQWIVCWKLERGRSQLTVRN